MKRMGHVIGLNEEVIDEYIKYHAEVWPDVLACISRCNIRNYTIFLRRPENLLFAYWEYHGDDFAADAARMTEDEATQRWWKIMGPMQEPLETRAPGEHWAEMQEVFHHD